MPRGGKRANAGRKEGAITKRSRKIATKATATAEGITPLEVMLGNMRFFYEAGEVALRQLLNGQAQPADIIAEHDPQQLQAEDAVPTAIDAFKLVLELRDKAGKSAADAARYCHAPIAAVQAKQGMEDHIPLAERLKAYAQTEAIDASQGKVVALKSRG